MFELSNGSDCHYVSIPVAVSNAYAYSIAEVTIE